MDELVELTQVPVADEIYMIVGWQQWADAGAISSGLPDYLIELTSATKIGEIRPDGFYLFQVPGTHHLLRPEIKLVDGHREELRTRKNEFYYTGDEDKGLVIFRGEEPHQNEARYAAALFDAVEVLGARRVVAIGGVYGAMPYDRDREFSCVYSLPWMKEELSNYACKFSNYEGGSTIGTYLVDQAEERDIEFLVFYGFVPSYDFSELSILLTGMRIENDYRAWYELMRRLNHMFGMEIDLSDLQQKTHELTASMDAQIDELEQKAPRLKIREYLQELASEFDETPFMPLGDVWERELRDLFDSDESGGEETV
jgi:predicted ATP-grasp superfamily ATP-dependent carboligase